MPSPGKAQPDRDRQAATAGRGAEGNEDRGTAVAERDFVMQRRPEGRQTKARLWAGWRPDEGREGSLTYYSLMSDKNRK